MEVPKSTPHCSFILYLDQQTELFNLFAEDLRSFFTKFPLKYEVLVVLEKGTAPPKSLEGFRFLTNVKRTERSLSLRQAMDQAEGTFLVLTDIQMTTPLGDLFKLLQHLMTEEELDLCWGERYTKKQSPLRQPQTPRHKTENLFNQILREKWTLTTQDPLCETVALKKKTWLLLRNQIPNYSGWYLAPSLHFASKKANLKTFEVFVNDSGQSPHFYPLWKERIKLLLTSIF